MIIITIVITSGTVGTVGTVGDILTSLKRPSSISNDQSYFHTLHFPSKILRFGSCGIFIRHSESRVLCQRLRLLITAASWYLVSFGRPNGKRHNRPKLCKGCKECKGRGLRGFRQIPFRRGCGKKSSSMPKTYHFVPSRGLGTTQPITFRGHDAIWNTCCALRARTLANKVNISTLVQCSAVQCSAVQCST